MFHEPAVAVAITCVGEAGDRIDPTLVDGFGPIEQS